MKKASKGILTMHCYLIWYLNLAERLSICNLPQGENSFQ